LKALSPDISIILEKLSIKESLRAEDLSPDDYLALAEVILGTQNPVK
jgi:16S rRNA A1518/A1519 N6-dimethyltransferase RsmA/KsgA/DIM1 with predicted DNA glycosylase/AP lyase activity